MVNSHVDPLRSFRSYPVDTKSPLPMGLFKRKAAPLPETLTHEPKSESPSTDVATAANSSRKQELPKYNHNGHLVTRGIHPDGESGRSGKVSLASEQYQQLGPSVYFRLSVLALLSHASIETSLFLLTYSD